MLVGLVEMFERIGLVEQVVLVVGVVTVVLIRIAGMVLLVVWGGGGGVSCENCVGFESSFTPLNVPLDNWRVQTGSLILRQLQTVALGDLELFSMFVQQH